MSAQADLTAEPPLTGGATTVQHGAPATPAAPAAAISQPAAQPAAQPTAVQPAAPAQPPIEHGYDFSRYANEDNAARYHSFGAVAHAEGLSQKAVDALASWDQAQEAHAQGEYEKNSEATYATLQQRWGREFDANLRVAATFISGQPSALQPGLKMLADISPDWCQQLVNWGKQAPIDVAEPRPAVDGELAKLKAMMADHRSAYWRGDNAERNQARYRELVEANPPQRPQDGYVVGSRQRFAPSGR